MSLGFSYCVVCPSLSTNLDKTILRSLFLCDFHAFFLHLFDTFRLFLQDDLNVCGLTSVLSNSTVSTVRSSSSGGCAIDLRMVNDECFGVKTLGLGVGNSVLQQILVDGSGFDRPATFATGSLALLSHSFATNTSCELDKWDNGLEGKDIVEHLQCFVNVHALGEVSNLSAVLEMHTKMRPTSLGGLLRDLWFYTVTNHIYISV
jgi:hypothetical protein